MGKHVVVGLFVLNAGEKGGEVVRQVCLPLAGLAVDVDDFLPDVDIRDFKVQDFADAHAGAQGGLGYQADFRGNKGKSVKETKRFVAGEEAFAGIVRAAKPHLACGRAHGAQDAPFHALVDESAKNLDDGIDIGFREPRGKELFPELFHVQTGNPGRVNIVKAFLYVSVGRLGDAGGFLIGQTEFLVLFPEFADGAADARGRRLRGLELRVSQGLDAHSVELNGVLDGIAFGNPADLFPLIAPVGELVVDVPADVGFAVGLDAALGFAEIDARVIGLDTARDFTLPGAGDGSVFL